MTIRMLDILNIVISFLLITQITNKIMGIPAANFGISVKYIVVIILSKNIKPIAKKIEAIIVLTILHLSSIWINFKINIPIKVPKIKAIQNKKMTGGNEVSAQNKS